MRGNGETNGSLWYSICIDDPIESDHPLRAIKRMVDDALRGMDGDFRKAYSDRGRPSVAPERLLKALLLQTLYTIRSERELCRRMKTDLLFRWFLDMTPDDEIFVPTVFTHNRERLAEHGLTQHLFAGVVQQAIAAGLASDEHFAVDGSLIQSHASLNSLKRIAREGSDNDDDKPTPSGGPGRRSRNESVDFKGERRGNATHRSATDPEARLYRKGNNVGAFLSHTMHALTENRNGLVLAVEVAEANGRSERACAMSMVRSVRTSHKVRVTTLAADTGYDSGDFLVALEAEGVRPHVAVRDGVIRAQGEEGDARRRARTSQQPRISSVSAQAKDRRRILRLGDDDRGTAAIKACSTVEDQAASRTDGRGIQPRANEKASGGVKSVKHSVRTRSISRD